jgi:hypothetical protein
MSNPKNLQELADSLAVLAGEARQRAARAKAGHSRLTAEEAYNNGYMSALLDTRATVLAMIQAEPMIQADKPSLHKANPRPYDPANQAPVCVECGKAIKHLPAGQGWVHEDTGMVVG